MSYTLKQSPTTLAWEIYFGSRCVGSFISERAARTLFAVLCA